MNDPILVSTTNDIASITLNRTEKRNAMNGALVKTLSSALHTFASDASRVLLIRGDGEHFCAGADIAWMQQITNGSYSDNYDDAQALADMLYQLYTFPKPTIVLTQGACMGGGLGLVAACDIAIAATDATFGFSEVKIGLAPSTISPYVIAAIGERAAHYYFLTGERFNAETAKNLQLIHQVTEPDALMSTGLTLANVLLKNSPAALIAIKQLIRQVAKEKMNSELAQKTAEHLANLRSLPDAQEGLAAFLEKRE